VIGDGPTAPPAVVCSINYAVVQGVDEVVRWMCMSRAVRRARSLDSWRGDLFEKSKAKIQGLAKA